jgi:hypothetical protein
MIWIFSIYDIVVVLHMLLARSRGAALSDLKGSMITKQCVFVEILSAVPHILERGRENLNM